MKNSDYCSIYIVRHGETEWNVKGIIQGYSDIPLNKKGKLQAKKLGNKLKHIHFSAVFSSDLIRAKRTAELITLEKKLEVQTTKVLRERFFGSHEGKKTKDLGEKLKVYLKKIAKLSFLEKFKSKFEDMETDEEMMARFIPFIREVAVAYRGKNILIVSHGGIMRVFLVHLGFATFADFPQGKAIIKNTSYIIIKSDGVDFFVKEVFGIEKKIK